MTDEKFELALEIERVQTEALRSVVEAAPIGKQVAIASRGVRCDRKRGHDVSLATDLVSLAVRGMRYQHGRDGAPATAHRVTVAVKAATVAVRYADRKDVTGALRKAPQRARNDARAGNTARAAIEASDREIDARIALAKQAESATAGIRKGTKAERRARARILHAEIRDK